MTSCWIFYMNYTVMHGSTNIKIAEKFRVFWDVTANLALRSLTPCDC